MAPRLWGYRDGEPWMLNPLAGSAGLAGGSLAVWNPRRPRRLTMKARRRRRRARQRNMPMRARRRYYRPHRRRRPRALMRYVANAPRRRRARVGVLPGLPPIAQMLPPVAAGIGSGLLVGWGAPMAATWFGVAPAGFMYRLIQAGVAWVGAWALGAFRVVDRTSTVAFATVGTAIAGLGLISDWQRGLIGGAPAAAAPAEVSGLGQDEDYDTMMGYYEPYGVGPTMGYYEAVA